MSELIGVRPDGMRSLGRVQPEVAARVFAMRSGDHRADIVRLSRGEPIVSAENSRPEPLIIDVMAVAPHEPPPLELRFAQETSGTSPRHGVTS